MATGVRPINLFADFMAGREAAHSDRAMRNRNALADIDIERERGVNALMQSPEASPEQYARAGRSDIGNAITNTRQFEQNSKMQAVQQLGTVAQKALTLPPQTRKQFLQQAAQVYGGAFQALGADMSQLPQMLAMPDDQLEQSLLQVAAFGPGAPDTGPLESFIDPRTNQPVLGTRQQALGRRPYDKPPSTIIGAYRALTPAEIQQAGLPAGTSAQIDENTGKIDVLSKRDTTATLSQKDATTAKMKLNTVQLAKKQLANIRARFGQLKGSVAAGPFGQGMLPTESGRSFDRSVDQMRSTLTALTRVPGVGAMSDYETKLDQAKFPTRGEYESVTQQQIDDLDDQLSLIETGYRDLLTGGNTSQPAETQSTGPVRVNTPQEAMALPSGTQFVTPDGRVKVRP